MKTNSFYVVGGQQKENAHTRKEWQASKKGLVLRVNPNTGVSESCVEYESPPDVCADDDPSILFKAGSLKNNKLYVCTQTEILIFALPGFKKIGYISIPCFNDLHHVYPVDNGNLLVAVTGLDIVIEITQQGEILREWNVLEQDTWSRFSRETDYRKVLTTKPHLAHPNFVFQIGQEVWATRFKQKDAVCLTKPNKRFNIGIEGAHDGIIFEDKIYFTTVDGHIVIANLKNRQVERAIDLNEINKGDKALGWCRGIHIEDKDHIIVGFSRLRPTKIRENLKWLRHRFKLHSNAGKLPTRIALYNTKQKKLCWTLNLENKGAMMNQVFSIHPATD